MNVNLLNKWFLILAGTLLLAGTGCDDGGGGGGGDTSDDTDTSDTSDADTDTDSDGDTDADSDTDSDTDSDSDSDSDTETASEGPIDTDVTLDDLREIRLDSANALRLTLRASNASESVPHAYLTTWFGFYHTPSEISESTYYNVDMKSTNAAGVVSVSLPAMSYYVNIDAPALRINPTDIGSDICYSSPVGMACNGYNSDNIPTLPTEFAVDKTSDVTELTMQASRINFNVSIPTTAKLTSLTIEIYRVNKNGVPTAKLLGTLLKTLSFTHDAVNNPLNSEFTASVEAFSGNYRAIARGTAVDDYVAMNEIEVHPFVTDVITVGTDGETINEPIEMNSIKNTVALTIQDRDGAAMPTIAVNVVDCKTGWTIGSGLTNASGVTDINAGNFSNVVALADTNRGGYSFGNLASANAGTIRQRWVNGSVTPTTAAENGGSATFTQIFDGCLATAGFTGALDTTNGEFPTDQIIYGSSAGLEYSVSVSGLEDFYPTASETVSVLHNQDPDAVSVSVARGGIISGTLTKKNGGAPVENILVQAIGAGGAGSDISLADGTYEIHVPAGDYTMVVGGAVNADVTVTAGETVTRNYKQGPYSGIVVRDNDDQGIEGALISGTAGTATDADGYFTLEFFQGTNWVCVNPNMAPYAYNVGFECLYGISVTPADLDN